jgi:hypothetical protein
MKDSLQQSLRSLLSFRYGDVFHPMRDWFFVLAFAAILLVGSIVLNVWLFDKVVRGELVDGTLLPNETNALENLPTIRSLLEERRAEEMRYKTTATFVDPSGFAE